jgi:predicted XRE-type DNA-binding protein
VEARSISEALKLIIEQRGGSQGDLGRALGVTQKWVSNVILGKRDPGITRTAGYLARVGWEVRMAPRGEDDPVKRRNFLAGVTSVTFVPSPQASPFQDPEYVAGLAARLDHMCDEIGGIPLVSTALRHFRSVQGAINSQDRELQVAASDLARKASRVLYDAKRFDATQNAGTFALSLAQKADYTEGMAHSFANLCTFNVSDSNNRIDAPRAVNYAQLALKLPELTEEHRARLNVRLATALTKMPVKPTHVVGLLDKAREATELSRNTTGMIMGNAGLSLGRLRRYDDAYESLDKAIALFSGNPHMQSMYLAVQIATALDASEPSMAADRMRVLSHVAPLVTSARLDQRVGEILVKSSRWADSSEMRDSRDQLRVAVPLPPMGGPPGGATRR